MTNTFYYSNEYDKYQVGGCLPVDSPDYVRRKCDQELYKSLIKLVFSCFSVSICPTFSYKCKLHTHLSRGLVRILKSFG